MLVDSYGTQGTLDIPGRLDRVGTLAVDILVPVVNMPGPVADMRALAVGTLVLGMDRVHKQAETVAPLMGAQLTSLSHVHGEKTVDRQHYAGREQQG